VIVTLDSNIVVRAVASPQGPALRPGHRPQCANPDAVLYPAAAGKADVLCTRNIRHFDVPEVQDFCSAHGIRVLTDLDVLRELLG